MRLTFDNRIALVTGAGRGIGKAIALSLAAEGVTVICVSKSLGSCGAVAEEIQKLGGRAKAWAVDVADESAVSQAAQTILAEFGKVDILINNAGITRDNLLLRMTAEAWDEVLRTNLTSCFYWCKTLVHPMARARWGRMVNISSVIGLMGNAGQANYAAAKAGMIGFTKTLAREFASRQLTANAVAPGFIQTDMTSGLPDQARDKVLEMIPLRRLGQPEDVARMVTFLCSEEAGYITGQVFTVDGGMAM